MTDNANDQAMFSEKFIKRTSPHTYFQAENAGLAWSSISGIKYLETTELLYIERGSTKSQCQQKGTHNGVVPDLQIKCTSRFASKSSQRATKFHFYQQNPTTQTHFVY